MKHLKHVWLLVVLLALAACGQQPVPEANPDPEVVPLDNVQIIANVVMTEGKVAKLPGETGTATFWLEATDKTATVGDANGCNASTNQQVTITVSSSALEKVTLTGARSDGTVAFSITACGPEGGKDISYTVNSGATPGDVTISGSGSGGKNNSTFRPNAFVIAIGSPSKTTPTIDWTTPSAITYGTALSGTQLNATASVPGTFAYDPQSGTVLNVNSHPLSVFFTPTDTSKYNSASKEVTLVVNKANQSVTFDELSKKTFGAAPFTISATGGDSGNPVTFALGVNSKGCSVATENGATTVTITGATAEGESCTITASQAGNDNYHAASMSRSFTIGKASQTITFAQPPTPAAFGSTFDVSGSSTSSLTVSFAVRGVCSLADGKVTMTSGTGECVITASQAGNGNYESADNVERTVNAKKADQTITFGDLPGKIFGDPAFIVSAAGGASGNAVSFTVAGNCTASGSTISITGAGSCTITASQPGNDNYNAAEDVSKSFTINKADQSISFTGAPSMEVFGNRFPVIATGGASGQAVVLAASGACTISGNEVTMTSGTGTCSLTANQAGNDNYNAAPQATQSITAQKATATVTLGDLNYVFDGTAKSATVTTEPRGLRVDTTYNDSSSAPSAVGSYSVNATINDQNYQGIASDILTISAWTLRGFYSPVDMSSTSTIVWNTVKNGSTVPLKFNVFAGTTERTSTADIQSFSAVKVMCLSGSEDAIEEFATTGGTNLRYSDGKFIQNWATPKAINTCYKVTVTTKDTSTISAYFKLK